MKVQIDCPPKINLYLRVVRRRDDGYHELETVFQSVGGGDLLQGAPAPDFALQCSDPELPTDSRNLVVKAAEVLRARYPGCAGGAALRLEKRTPMGAGMGGGSVDGAAALVLLSELWGLSPSPTEMAQMAAELGSDVPFFLVGGTALGRGRGEQLEPLATPPLWLVLLKPPVSVSTPWAYRQWRPESCGGPDLAEFVQALETGDARHVAGLLRNDLEPGVAAGTPEIAAAQAWMEAQDLLGVRMTGSGSVVFGVARDEGQAREVVERAGAPGFLWAAPCLTAAEARLVSRPADAAPPAP